MTLEWLALQPSQQRAIVETADGGELPAGLADLRERIEELNDEERAAMVAYCG